MTQEAQKPGQKIRLITRNADLVHEAVIPVFNETPVVILWGTRVFKRAFVDLGHQSVVEVYSECFAYALP